MNFNTKIRLHKDTHTHTHVSNGEKKNAKIIEEPFGIYNEIAIDLYKNMHIVTKIYVRGLEN